MRCSSSTDPGSAAAVILRGVTGAAMAGVYPIGMKIAVSWADKDRGLLVGLLVGALTVGSASPHLFAFLGGVDWRLIMGIASGAALLGAVVINFRAGRAEPRRQRQIRAAPWR